MCYYLQKKSYICKQKKFGSAYYVVVWCAHTNV